MRLRPFVASSIFALVVIASHRAEASAILFNDRGQFDAALNGDYQSPTALNFTGLTDIDYSNDGRESGCVGSAAFTAITPSSQSVHVDAHVTAVGFDLVATKTMSDAGFQPGVPLYDPAGPIPDVLFTFKTVGGINSTSIVPLDSFLGVMLIDDVFSDLTWYTNADCGFCVSLFAIDNLANGTETITEFVVREPVPEPATAVLVLAGAMVLFQRRRFTRPK